MPFGFSKKDKGEESHGHSNGANLPSPEFRMFRSDTSTQEEIFAPANTHHDEKPKKEKAKRLSFLRRSSSASAVNSSEHIPENLVSPTAEGTKGAEEDKWEWRASQLGLGGGTTPVKERSLSLSDQGTDNNIQEAIRLHEEGDLENSTRLFKQLADPNGANNPLSQVLYGLAIRHGWGCQPNSEEAVKYLQAAAANSALIEQEALRAGMKKGGAAKGELVLAIFELGNCFRHGWGTEKDPVAAFNYYQTAANLGDTDAMNETGWCYLNGYGLKKKDKYMSAKYYRLAEENGNKTVGNSWIYKDKYVNPPK
ncbi:hypothetical protein H072_7693 [Dactylellina haptotyla CBS 200.50]|uniref:HCP-like protein n=1 Tax=Dactylellina haptotyla (strain CBS 200.50) TaxID=1284197 RepID=S8A6A9_DACHA|nr:hypothetical protein H072_7693 [Dactylellina haptotyla CBS 200.50]